MGQKVSSYYVCQQCGYTQIGWAGRCPSCGAWGSLVETVIERAETGTKKKVKREKARPVSLLSVLRKETSRISTKISELDRVLGGGLVPGQVILIAGEPGIGKSTLLLEVAEKLGNVFYVSGEESITQIKLRADRLGLTSKKIKLLEETDIDNVIDVISDFFDPLPKAVIVDSIQTMTTADLGGVSGSVGQVRECAYRLVRYAKAKDVCVFMIGHVTKEGAVAGPAVLMHIVDTVLWFEGDKTTTIRLLRAVKNRFGPTDEVGVFEMQEKGLVSVDNPERHFLSSQKKATPGSIITCLLQGSRPLLTEIQSLVIPSKMAFPKRVAHGIDLSRLELLLAVLQRRCGIPLYEFDCFVNVTGGITIKNDPSSDLAACLSIASAFFDKPLPKNSVAIGEVGLLGDIRKVFGQEKRVKEARRLGYTNIITSDKIKFLQQGIKLYLR